MKNHQLIIILYQLILLRFGNESNDYMVFDIKNEIKKIKLEKEKKEEKKIERKRGNEKRKKVCYLFIYFLFYLF